MIRNKSILYFFLSCNQSYQLVVMVSRSLIMVGGTRKIIIMFFLEKWQIYIIPFFLLPFYIERYKSLFYNFFGENHSGGGQDLPDPPGIYAHGLDSYVIVKPFLVHISFEFSYLCCPAFFPNSSGYLTCFLCPSLFLLVVAHHWLAYYWIGQHIAVLCHISSIILHWVRNISDWVGGIESAKGMKCFLCLIVNMIVR